MPRSTCAVVVAAITLLTGCAADDGWSDEQVGHIAFERPTDWQTSDPGDDTWDLRLVGDGMEVQVAGTFSDDVTASGALSRLDLPAMLHLEDYDGGGADALEVEGADTAVRSDFTYTDAATPMEGVWLIAGQFPYPATAVITVTGEEIDDDVLDRIIASLRFR